MPGTGLDEVKVLKAWESYKHLERDGLPSPEVELSGRGDDRDALPTVLLVAFCVLPARLRGALAFGAEFLRFHLYGQHFDLRVHLLLDWVWAMEYPCSTHLRPVFVGFS